MLFVVHGLKLKRNKMCNNLPKLNALRKEMSVRYFYSIIIISSFFAIYYLYENIKPMNYWVSLCSVGHILLLIVPYKLSFKSFKPLVPFYIVYISLYLFGNAVFFWCCRDVLVFMWYAAIPIAAMIFYTRKIVIAWSIYVIIHVCAVFIVVPFIPKNYFVPPSDSQMLFLDISTIILWLGLMAFFIYYLRKIYSPETSELNESGVGICVIDDVNEEIKEETDGRLDALYIEILNYFSARRPYCNPDFTIVQLAKELKTNVKYVSRVIKIKENANFCFFLNKYRIELIKGLIAKDYLSKYTIRHIYTSAGFRHQSTFNKVFKEIEGITPSEYIKNSKMEKSVLQE